MPRFFSGSFRPYSSFYPNVSIDVITTIPNSVYFYIPQRRKGKNLDTDIAVAGNWTNNGTAVNGFTATGNAYAVKRGTDKTTDGVTTVYVPRKSGVTCTTANDDCKAIKVYDVTKTQYLQEITADNTDLCAGKLADGLSCGVTTWGQESSMLSYANAYATANIGKVNDVTKFTTNGATPTAVDTMPDAVTNPSQITTMTWDEGEYVYNMPTNTTSCGSKPNGIEDCAVIPSANNGQAATDADPAELRLFAARFFRFNVLTLVVVLNFVILLEGDRFYLCKTGVKSIDF